MTRRPQGLGDSAWAGLTSCLLNAKKKCVVRSPESLLCLWLPQLPQLLQLLASLCWVPWIFPTSWCFNNSTILSCYGAGIGIESFPTLVCNVCPIVKLWFGLSQAHCTCATRDQPIEFCRRQVVFEFWTFLYRSASLHHSNSFHNVLAHVPTSWAMLAALNSVLAQPEYQATWWWECDVYWLKKVPCWKDGNKHK